jgi:beta-phosphoglucomutase
MTLKAVLFDFNGVIINDEAIHERLLEQVLLEENLRFKPEEFRQYALGRSDRVALMELCELRGRVLTESALQHLMQRKLQAYQATLQTMETLPIYEGIVDFIQTLRSAGCKLAVVSGAMRVEIELVLTQMGVRDAFSAIVSGDEISSSKPDPEGYLLGVKRLQTLFPELGLTLDNCLAIEDSFPGIQAAKAAGLGVVGVANTYPFHMLHRMATWAVDSLIDLELERFLPQITTIAEDPATTDSASE